MTADRAKAMTDQEIHDAVGALGAAAYLVEDTSAVTEALNILGREAYRRYKAEAA